MLCKIIIVRKENLTLKMRPLISPESFDNYHACFVMYSNFQWSFFLAPVCEIECGCPSRGNL